MFVIIEKKANARGSLTLCQAPFLPHWLFPILLFQTVDSDRMFALADPRICIPIHPARNTGYILFREGRENAPSDIIYLL